MTQIDVEPIHGWGWQSNVGPIDAPAKFGAQVRVADNSVSGEITDGPLNKREIEMTPRHTEWDGFMNVEIIGSGERLVGFASVPIGLLRND